MNKLSLNKLPKKLTDKYSLLSFIIMNNIRFKRGHKSKLKTNNLVQHITLVKYFPKVRDLLFITPLPKDVIDITYSYFCEEFDIQYRLDQHSVDEWQCHISLPGQFTVIMDINFRGPKIILNHVNDHILKYVPAFQSYDSDLPLILQKVNSENPDKQPVNYHVAISSTMQKRNRLKCLVPDQTILNEFLKRSITMISLYEDTVVIPTTLDKFKKSNVIINTPNDTSCSNVNCLNIFFNEYLTKYYGKEPFFEYEYHQSLKYYPDSDCYLHRISQSGRRYREIIDDSTRYMVYKIVDHKLFKQMIVITQLFSTAVTKIYNKIVLELLDESYLS